MKNYKDSLIVALDNDAANKFTLLKHKVSNFKVGLPFLTTDGGFAQARQWAKTHGIFVDLKLDDIPNTVENAVRNVKDFKFVTVHGSNDKAMEAAGFVNSNKDVNVGALAVTVLTSDEDTDVEERVVEIADNAFQAGMKGIVCSGHELHLLTDEKYDCLLKVVPGVRLKDDSKHDQIRTVTPYDAIIKGADYIVVGRPITEAENPCAMVDKYLAEVRKAWDELYPPPKNNWITSMTNWVLGIFRRRKKKT